MSEEFDFESIKNKTLEQLKSGKPLLSKDGAFAPLLESILNAALEGEMDAHLSEDERMSGNRRNGKMQKQVQTSMGEKWTMPSWLMPCSFFTYVAVSEINQLFKGGVVREHALVFCHFPHLAVIALDCIRGINHTSYIRRKLEVFSKPFPVILPRLDNDRVFLTPFFFQIKKSCLSGFLIYRTIDMFQIPHELFLMFAAYILDGVTYLITIQSWTIVSGNPLRIASGKPFKPSTQAMSMSWTPWGCKSVNTFSQKFGPHF